VKRDAAAVVAALGLLDARVEGEVRLPDRRRARERSGLEADVEVGLQERHLRDFSKCKAFYLLKRAKS